LVLTLSANFNPHRRRDMIQRRRMEGLVGLLLLSSCSRVWADKIDCIAGCGASVDAGLARGARLNEPFGMAFDQSGNGYVCEHEGQKILKIDSHGFIGPFAGLGVLSFGSKNQQTDQAVFNHPHGLIVTKDQQILVADTLNHRIQRINLKSGEMSTIAGTGKPGFSGDGGPATQAAFNGIYAIDASWGGDKIYLVDRENRRVGWIDLRSGVVRTLAGNGEGGVPGEGEEAAKAPLVDPRAVTVDAKGNVYILERGGNALRMV